MSYKRKVNQQKRSASLWWLLSFLVLVIGIMLLISDASQQRVLQPTPPLTESEKIKSMIDRRTDVTVLKVAVGNIIRIEYDLVPQFGQRNEWIHDQQMLKIICALQPVGHTITFVGSGRFKDEYGKIVHKPTIETKITATAINRIGCSADAADIDWGKISLSYESNPAPRGRE